MLIDSHCHLPKDFHEAEEVIKNAGEEGVVGFVNIGTSLESSSEAAKIAESFEGVYSSVAVYPHEDLSVSLDQIKNELSEIAKSSPKVKAVGECGIDISEWGGGRSIEDQTKLFELQIQLALDLDLPIILHNRNGDEIVLKLFDKYKSESLRGVAHCFSSDWEFGQKLLDYGFYLSFSGMITYKSRNELREVLAKVPMEKILIETDAPYLPPEGHRGEKNQPKYVKIVARKVAEVRGLPLETIEKYTYDNTSRLFRL